MNLVRVHTYASVVAFCLFSAFSHTVASVAPPPTQGLATETNSLAKILYKNYSQIKTISCQIQKTTKGGEQTVRLLSRVHYKYPDHIHVENVSPIKRTIIADGKNLYYYQEHSLRGFSKPINELSKIWLASLRNIPGTPLDNLFSLYGIPEIKLPDTKDGLIQRGYQAEKTFVVLVADKKYQLQQINFFKSSKMETKTGEYKYLKQKQISDNCWLPTLHKAVLYLPDGNKVTETSRITNVSVNSTIPDNLFNHKLFMKDVEFTSKFENTYQ